MKQRTSITIEPKLLKQLEQLVKEGRFPSVSFAIGFLCNAAIKRDL